MRRFRQVLAVMAAAASLAAAPRAPGFAPVVPGEALSFPTDHGAHPAFRTEWWYVTGWLRTSDQRDLGFQVTFFRSRTGFGEGNPSAFAPKQVLFAHAALSDPALGHLLHDQRIAREGFGLAEASTVDTDIRLQDWVLKRDADGRFRTHAGGRDFTLDLTLRPTQPPLLQGERGYSRKGPEPHEASYYYSLPHLAVTGTVVRQGRKGTVIGEAWLDREWSSTLLDPSAVGWDWVGLNLADGSSLTAFQVRDREGRALWAGGSFRKPGQAPERLDRNAVSFISERSWRSPRTGAIYPIQRGLTLNLREGSRSWSLVPLFDDQELDSRLGGGPVYWEGAVTTAGGHGYLELTGYLTAMKL